MAKILIVIAFAAAACGSANSPAGTDGGTKKDGGTTGEKDAGVTTSNVPCDQTYTITETATAGGMIVTTGTYSIVDAVGPSTNFQLLLCNFTETENGSPIVAPGAAFVCPAGYTCNVTGTYPTATNACTTATTGSFYDGKLYVPCTTSTTEYNGSGSMTGQISTSYGSIQISY